ncbi:hypothetical protein CMV_017270 [Castanea mollissima]|uniref:Uncharacterized protein n=1 Tax=Castanea mollissima TaxID=60419 RepID=A0A8J4R500_9ROSI|nr:hypothetical protein CMV_017270 [Castanea mollissima]
MGSEFEKQDSDIISIFLELLGFDDLIGFKSSMEEECHYIVEGSLWYGSRIGSKMMGFKEKIALMTATMFGSKGVLNFILETSCVDVNQACGLDGLLHFLLLLLWTLLFQVRHGPMCTKVVSEHEDGQECSLTKCQFSHDQVSNKCLRESQRFKPRLRHSLPHERMEKHTLPLLGSTQREEDSKREITVIVHVL